MTSSLEAIKRLRDALAVDYAAQIANLAVKPGAVTAAIMPSNGVYEFVACDTVPITVTVEVTLLAASTGPQGATDLLFHVDPVAAICRTVGWTPTDWRADQNDDQPVLTLTCTATATG